ncbi:MAG TPA: N-6 DNA methylase [Ktedonobacteraceae bacterium]|nr:N-6 DNA methylase [Ktedonobacteraceae bacterium]
MKKKTDRVLQAKSSEVDAYLFIKDELRSLGWNTRNPARNASGQVYTQNECLAHPEIKTFLNLERPENIVKVTDSILWIIEAKRYHKQLDQALEEAEDYAEKINQGQNLRALFISGVAGNQHDGYLIKTCFLHRNGFKPITSNGKEISSLVSPEICKTVLHTGPTIKDIPIDEALFLSKAEKINQYLHLGAINKNQRARVMAALLLALAQDSQPDVDSPPSILIEDINSRARDTLRKQGKPEFHKYIEIALPPTQDNHVKFKKALIHTIQELNNLNIRSAMNSGTDVLGKFYEVFLKYGNGAKEIGIVLTPRHITQFVVKVMNINDRDVVYDPTCGTGGFLVAAFDHIKQTCSEKVVQHFKTNNLFGVEQEAEVVSLALVNMIFRGDGKSNIIEGNCFRKHLARAANGGAMYVTERIGGQESGVTKVLMNPPFALKASDEKEYRFIDHALHQMQDGGILFSVLPYSAMVKPGEYLEWRVHSLLRNNTLLCVITFPEDLFYPVGVHTIGIFVKKGISHRQEQKILWIRALNDGLLKSKGKRLPNFKAKNDLLGIEDFVRSFLINQSTTVENKERFQKACPIDFDDSLLELVPENYLDQSPPSEDEIRDGIEQVIREAIAFLILERKENE